MFLMFLIDLKTLKTLKTQRLQNPRLGTCDFGMKNINPPERLVFLMFLNQAFLGINVFNVFKAIIKTLKTQASWGINVFNVFNSKITSLKSRILEPLCF